MFPTIAKYNQTIQASSASAFRSLRGLTFIPSRTVPVSIYSYGSGSYAVVFKAKDSQGQKHAIRCFISAEPENIERYRFISVHLKLLNESWVTPLDLLEEEVKVDAKQYPVIRMDWNEGQLLNAYVSDILHNNEAISALQEELFRVGRRMEECCVGHGDIQCGNVMVHSGTAQPVVKLIDYDGMYVPALQGRRSLERGRTEFQHPDRRPEDFNERMDRFSFWVILTALEALKWDKSLWKEVMQGGFNTLDNMLFTADDLRDLGRSRLVDRLHALQQPALDFYVDQLFKARLGTPGGVAAASLYQLHQNGNVLAEPKTSPESGDDVLEVLSSPDGATVIMSHGTEFKRLGKTPLTLPHASFLNRTLVITFGTEIVRKEVGATTRRIQATFAQVSSPATAPTPATGNGNTGNKDSGAQQAPAQPPPLTPATPPGEENGLRIVIAVGLIVVIIGILVAVANSKKPQDYSDTAALYSTSETPLTDTTATVTPAAADTTPIAWTPAEVAPSDATLPDTTRVVTTTTDTDNGWDSEFNSARGALRQFFLDINNRDRESAWARTYVPEWETLGKTWFLYRSEYSDYTTVHIESVEPRFEYGDEARFAVVFKATNYLEQTICLRKEFTLKKLRLDGNTTRWMITSYTDEGKSNECN